MRVNVYSEEMTNRVEIIEKVIDGHTFTAVRFYLELPVTVPRNDLLDSTGVAHPQRPMQVQGPFIHHPGDDDSSAVTFWGKHDLREVLQKALRLLDEHYEKKEKEHDHPL